MKYSVPGTASVVVPLSSCDYNYTK